MIAWEMILMVIILIPMLLLIIKIRDRVKDLEREFEENEW